MFKTVKVRKPDSSRARSREVFIVATGYKGLTILFDFEPLTILLGNKL